MDMYILVFWKPFSINEDLVHHKYSLMIFLLNDFRNLSKICTLCLKKTLFLCNLQLHQLPTDLVIFTGEVLNGKLNIL